ncbi:MAG: hypothetical protein WED07_00905 [Candidatus Freyarchaeum deiterrae]
MSKKGRYKHDLDNLLDEFLDTEDEGKLFEYLISNSNLPGPRGNLELAAAFADVVEAYLVKSSERLWKLCLKLIQFPADEAPVNNPKEFLVFCGAFAIGAIGSVSSVFFEKALTLLRELSNDARWRVREGVAMGLQKLIERQSQKTLKELEGWIAENNWLTMRAVAAGVAEPALLRNEQNARWALELHKKIFAQILATKDRKSEEFKKLRQALGYSVSVVIQAIPKDGFEYVHQLIDSQDADILWIIKENLKKSRLTKNFPDEISSINKLLLS